MQASPSVRRSRFGSTPGLVLGFVLTLGTATLPPSPAFAQPSKPAAKPAAAPAQDLITKGRQLFDDQQYEESIQALSAVLLKPNNTREQKIEVYRLLALNYITLGRKDEADNAVRGLLVVDPEYQMPPSESPRFRDFFAQARQKWEAEGRPGLVADAPPKKPATPIVLKHASPTQVDPGQSVELRAKLEDPESRVASVKIYFRAGSSGDFTEGVAQVEGDTVRAQIPGSSVNPPLVDYYFDLLDGAGTVVGSRGDSQNPLRFAVSEPSKGWVLPVAIGGGILGAAAIIGVLALAGVFKSDSASTRGTSTVSVNVGETGIRF